MKKEINIERVLDKIAIEEAPGNLIYKWKVEVQLQKDRKRFYVELLRPSIVLPFILAGFWYYFAMFKKELFEYYLVDRLGSLFQEISPIFVSSTSSFASSYYYLVGAAIFSMALAAISLFWFYQGKKVSYARIRY